MNKAKIGLGVLVLIGAGVFVAMPKKIKVFLDNGTNKPVVVTIDGGDKVEVAAFDVKSVEMSGGKHKLEAADKGGAKVDEVEFDGGRRNPFMGERYVFNVAGANHYEVAAAAYGSAKEPPWRKLTDTNHVFAVPSEAAPDLLATFPSSVQVKGNKGKVEQRLWHTPLHEGRPCCRTVVAAEKAAGTF
jgi:hypothetical protein